jgi:hypothetical protein
MHQADLSTPASVTRRRNGCAGAREPKFPPLFNADVRQAPSQSVKRHRNGCAGVGEPIFALLFNAAVCQAPGSRFLLPFSTLPSVKRHRNGRASAGSRFLLPFQRCLQEPIWFPFQGYRTSSPIAIGRKIIRRSRKLSNG